MSDDLRERRRQRLERERQWEEHKAAEEKREQEKRKREEEKRLRRQDRAEIIARISFIVLLAAIGFLIFYFRSGLKNAAIAVFDFLFVHDSNFWTIFWIVVGALVFLGLIVFMIRGWFEVGKAVGETVKGVAKLATTEVSTPRTKTEVYTHEATGTVVHYEIKGKSVAEFLMKQLVAESKMGKILDADPSAEMKDFESTLMVKVLSQNKGSRRSKGGIYT